ncbi:hypothetical protein K469DRAFT_742962 [Zopfia rhizophila CBS 207.26]|uniref:Amino acid transporter transmembrane domain-containing protein n=1 Tax=Zopfia rhizophila CBS 207.26 TaxID=1314779 RepID=A0A6A6DDM5_9PEZI|nr:hypothetical protein K469DRAFT_742962 [Zopfia rhizophila CBS 207.26]
MDAITEHAICTIVWGVVGFVVLWIFTLPRTLKQVSYLSIAWLSSFTIIGVGVNPTRNLHLNATVDTTLDCAFLCVSNIIFAFAGHVAFFSFISEFRDPTEFLKTVHLLQAIDTTMHVVVTIVAYQYTRNDVSSPVLKSTSNVVMDVAYRIALPTILLAGVIYGHVAAKYDYVRLFGGTKHMSRRTWLSIGSWAAITLTLRLIAWVIAESIPNFSTLLALISSLFASWFTYGLSGVFWNWKEMCLTALNLSIGGIGAAVCGIRLYASGKAIHDESGSSWTCADNSQTE